MKQAHTLREYQYYDKDTLCSIIDADFHHKAGACGKQSGFHSGHCLWGQHGTHLGRFSGISGKPLHSENSLRPWLLP